jgi:hypothetical protein
MYLFPPPFADNSALARWLPLHPSNNPFSFRFQLSPFGKWLTRNMLWLLEGIRYDALPYNDG